METTPLVTAAQWQCRQSRKSAAHRRSYASAERRPTMPAAVPPTTTYLRQPQEKRKKKKRVSFASFRGQCCVSECQFVASKDDLLSPEMAGMVP
eukprot:790335-Rhodomonas_salina.1